MKLLLNAKYYWILFLLKIGLKHRMIKQLIVPSVPIKKHWDISDQTSIVYNIFDKFNLRSGAPGSNHEGVLAVEAHLLSAFLINIFLLERDPSLHIRLKIYGDFTVYKDFDSSLKSTEFLYLVNHLSKKKSRLYIEIIAKDIENDQQKLITANELYLFMKSADQVIMKDRSNALVSLCDLKTLDLFYPVINRKINDLSSKDESDKVDVVITWVNSSDSHWQNLWSTKFEKSQSSEIEADSVYQDPDRFHSSLDLLFCLRSIYAYMSWVDKIYIVSNCNPPDWLNLDNYKINWVNHDCILDDNYLPTFNSHAIESALHKIPGLAENFIYFNDDFLVTKPTHKSFFFDSINRPIFHCENYSYIYESLEVNDNSTKEFLLVIA